MLRRINLLGGPGAGKSTMAAWLFAHLKLAGYKCELVTELVKSYAWEGRTINGFDQYNIFGKQMKREEIPLKGGADFIITDSPIVLSAFYGAKYDVKGWEVFLMASEEFERIYPSMNILLQRDSEKVYEPLGRFQTAEEALAIDGEIEGMLKSYNMPYALHPSKLREELLARLINRFRIQKEQEESKKDSFQ